MFFFRFLCLSCAVLHTDYVFSDVPDEMRECIESTTPSLLTQVQERYSEFQRPLKIERMLYMDYSYANKKVLDYPPPRIINQFLEVLQQSPREKVNRDLVLALQWSGVQWMIDTHATDFNADWMMEKVDNNILMRQSMREEPFIRCLYKQKDGHTLSFIPASTLENVEAFCNRQGFFSYQFSSQSFDPLVYTIFNGDTSKGIGA